jgi:outer membrane protein
MKSTAPIAILAALLVPAAWSTQTHAQDNSLRVGAYIVQYHVSADDISGPYVPPGVSLDVKNVNTLYFAYVRRLSARFDLEIAAGLPPKSETVGKGPATLGSVPYDGQVIATAKWFSPTVLLEYKFLEESSDWRPFAGVGINYTRFFDRKSTPEGDAANGGPTSISLSDSIGPAATVGIDYRLNESWHAYASYSVAKVKSKLEANTSGVVRSTTIEFNPSTWVLSIGYSF